MTLPELLEESWPIIQDLSSTYQDPQTFLILSSTTNKLLPNRDISLPKLAGDHQTIFEKTTPKREDPTKQTPPKPLADDTPLIDGVEREVWLINNAGLVIFAPYLEMLFERANLIQNKVYPDLEHQIRSIFLLHHLVTGQSEAEEHQLLLNRILCNVPLDIALPPTVTPEDRYAEAS